MITDLEARESYDPSSGDDLTLELVKPRRIASVQLLGTIEHDDDQATFSPGISVLPTLDTPAEIGSPDILRAVFEIPPRRNRPEGYEGKDFDYDLRIGRPPARPTTLSGHHTTISSRGRWRSWAIPARASRLPFPARPEGDGGARWGGRGAARLHPRYQWRICERLSNEMKPQRVARPRLSERSEFGVPIWFFNAEEICAWFSASEQTQEPVLKDWWAIAKGGNARPALLGAASKTRLQRSHRPTSHST